MGLGEFGNGQSAIGKSPDRFWARTTQGGSGAEEKAKVLRGLGFTVDGIRRVQQRRELHERPNPTLASISISLRVKEM